MNPAVSVGIRNHYARPSLREKCPYSDFYWPAFSRIWTEYGVILHIFPYSVLKWKNANQKNSEYGPFSRSVSSYG